jgi:hypothetical protein
MVKKKGDKAQAPKNGFGLALLFTLITLILVCYGLKNNEIFSLIAAILFGIVGLYWVKRSWMSYPVDKVVKKK